MPTRYRLFMPIGFGMKLALAWQQVVNQQLTVNSPVEFAENALVSAGRCFSQTQT